MSRRIHQVATAVALAALVTACSATSDGVGSLTTDDLEIVTNGFTGEATPVAAQLSLQADGCAAVVIDGTARLAFWPPGTTEEHVSVDPDAYEVRLPGGTVLSASGDEGDRFTADMLVHQEHAVPMTTADGTDYEKIAIIASFCDLNGPAVAIHDADTVVVGE